VVLMRLVPSDRQSKRLFHDVDYERSRRVMGAVDETNARHGHDTVRLGAARPDGRWKTKALRRSPRYTTRLREVLTIT
jgi:DNA polymerase V